MTEVAVVVLVAFLAAMQVTTYAHNVSRRHAEPSLYGRLVRPPKPKPGTAGGGAGGGGVGGGGGPPSPGGGWNVNIMNPSNQKLIPPTLILQDQGTKLPPPPPQKPAPPPPTNTDRLSQHHVETVLLLGGLLRDNVVNTLGLVLFSPKFSLDLDSYASLFDVYMAARARKLRTAEMLHVLRNLSVKPVREQFQILFAELERTVPRYLMGAVKLWLSALKGNKVNLDVILRPSDGPQLFTFINNIPLGSLNYVAKPPNFSPSTKQHSTPQVCRTLGTLMCMTLAALKDGSLVPSQRLIAGIMRHLPLGRVTAEIVEALRYVTDVLEQSTPSLDHAVQNVPPPAYNNPYDLVRHVLGNLQRINEDYFLPDALTTLLNNLNPQSYYTLNPHYSKMSQIVGKAVIDYVLLFKTVTPGEFPPDVVNLKDRVVAGITGGELDMPTIMKGFVLYEHSNPLDLLIAVLERIRRRGYVPPVLTIPINVLYLHLLFKTSTSEGKPPEDTTVLNFDNLAIAFYGFESPGLPNEVRQKAQNVLHQLEKVSNVNWDDVLKKFPVEENNRPRQLTVSVIKYLKDEVPEVSNHPVKNQIDELLQSIQDNGEPQNCPAASCDGQGQIVLDEPSTPPTIAPPPPPPATSSTNNPSIDDVDVGKLVDALGPDALQDPQIQDATDFFSSADFKSCIGNNFNDVSRSDTKGKLLKAIVVVLLRCVTVRENRDLQNALVYLLGKIRDQGSGAMSVTYLETKTRYIDLGAALEALDYESIQRDGKTDAVNGLLNFLQTIGSRALTPDFRYQKTDTKGVFLTKFFKHLLNLDVTSQEVRRYIQTVSNYVKMDGVGAETIVFTEE